MMKTYCFKIINDPWEIYELSKLLDKFTYLKKTLKINNSDTYTKNNFIFFKVNLEEFDTNLKKIKFLNRHVFQYQEPLSFYEKNNFLIQKNLFFDLLNFVFIKEENFIKVIFNIDMFFFNKVGKFI